MNQLHYELCIELCAPAVQTLLSRHCSAQRTRQRAASSLTDITLQRKVAPGHNYEPTVDCSKNLAEGSHYVQQETTPVLKPPMTSEGRRRHSNDYKNLHHRLLEGLATSFKHRTSLKQSIVTRTSSPGASESISITDLATSAHCGRTPISYRNV